MWVQSLVTLVVPKQVTWKLTTKHGVWWPNLLWENWLITTGTMCGLWSIQVDCEGFFILEQQLERKTVGWLAGGFQHNSKGGLINLYRALVCQHLEFCAKVWSHYLRKDILAIIRGETKLQQTDCCSWREHGVSDYAMIRIKQIVVFKVQANKRWLHWNVERCKRGWQTRCF